MSDDTTSDEQDTADDGVVLVSPGGDEVTVRSPEAVNNLVYGQGYRLKGDSDPEAAIQAATATTEGEGTAAPSAPDVGSTTKSTPKTGGKAAPGSTSTPPTT